MAGDPVYARGHLHAANVWFGVLAASGDPAPQADSNSTEGELGRAHFAQKEVTAEAILRALCNPPRSVVTT